MSEYSEKFFKVSHLGLCNGMPTHWFYPEQYMGGDERAQLARAVEACNDCPITQECFDHAIRHEEHGVWAGTTPRERRRSRGKLKLKFESLSQTAGAWNIFWDRP